MMYFIIQHCLSRIPWVVLSGCKNADVSETMRIKDPVF